MRKAEVYDKNVLAGLLIQTDNDNYIFRYDDAYYMDSTKHAISLTLPKTQQEYHSNVLFPFFFNMLSEGANKRIQCHVYKIDERDYFGLLLATASKDTIGTIIIKKIIEPFLVEQLKVAELIDHSFLETKQKRMYFASYRERLSRLQRKSE